MKARDVWSGVGLAAVLIVVAAVLLWLFMGCRAPDRWSAAVSRGDGELEGGGEWGDRDFDDTRLEVGISGPLLTAPPLRVERPAPAVAFVDLQPVIDELVALRKSLEAHAEPPSAVETGVTQAGILTAVLAAIAALWKYGLPAWKAWRAGKAS